MTFLTLITAIAPGLRLKVTIEGDRPSHPAIEAIDAWSDQTGVRVDRRATVLPPAPLRLVGGRAR